MYDYLFMLFSFTNSLQRFITFIAWLHTFKLQTKCERKDIAVVTSQLASNHDCQRIRNLFLSALFVDLACCYETCKITTLMSSERPKLVHMNSVLEMMNQAVTILEITVLRNGACSANH